jgi:ornithine carbamoyltransferase
MDDSNVTPIDTHPDYVAPPESEAVAAFGAHVVMMTDGAFALQVTGEPSLGDLQMVLSRALKSIEARMVAETVVQLQKQSASRIITPGR